jgi:hypothetical protein
MILMPSKMQPLEMKPVQIKLKIANLSMEIKDIDIMEATEIEEILEMKN